MTTPGMVIVGAGEAGARAALALRERGWTGSVTLVGSETHPPYERPPLSKAVMTEAEPTVRFILSDARLLEHDVTLQCGVPVIAIDREAHEIVLADERRVAYRCLLLATGATARQLNAKGAGPENLLYLRTFTEALALRARLVPGARLVVIGGGFIGLEIAASARARGADVTLVELGSRLLARGVPAEVAEIIARRHQEAGVTLRLGVGIERIETNGPMRAVILTDGTRIECDGVIAGVGAVPEATLAGASGLAIDNGVAVNDRLQTSDPDIFAAGDCCSFPHPLYDGRRIRLEAWRNAQDQGAVAAGNMLGEDRAYDAVPWFWSDQYDITLQIAGLPDEGAAMVIRDTGEGDCLYFHLAADGRLVAASGAGPIAKIARDIRLAEMLIARRATPAPADLVAPDVKLKSLLRG